MQRLFGKRRKEDAGLQNWKSEQEQREVEEVRSRLERVREQLIIIDRRRVSRENAQ